ncbi:MAG: hypothetical protein ACWA5T_00645, partial [Parvularcula sp.]
MKRLALIFSAVVFSLCGLLAMAEDRNTTPRIENIRLGVDASGQTRIVFDLDDQPAFEVWAEDEGGPALAVAISGASSTLSDKDLKPLG